MIRIITRAVVWIIELLSEIPVGKFLNSLRYIHVLKKNYYSLGSRPTNSQLLLNTPVCLNRRVLCLCSRRIKTWSSLTWSFFLWRRKISIYIYPRFISYYYRLKTHFLQNVYIFLKCLMEGTINNRDSTKYVAKWPFRNFLLQTKNLPAWHYRWLYTLGLSLTMKISYNKNCAPPKRWTMISTGSFFLFFRIYVQIKKIPIFRLATQRARYSRVDEVVVCAAKITIYKSLPHSSPRWLFLFHLASFFPTFMQKPKLLKFNNSQQCVHNCTHHTRSFRISQINSYWRICLKWLFHTDKKT